MARITDYPISFNQIVQNAAEYQGYISPPYHLGNFGLNYYSSCLQDNGARFSSYIDIPPNGMSIYFPVSYGFCNNCDYSEFFLASGEDRVFYDECLTSPVDGFNTWWYSYNDNASYIIDSNGYLSDYNPCGSVGCE
jgi:hypothetical protein